MDLPFGRQRRRRLLSSHRHGRKCLCLWRLRSLLPTPRRFASLGCISLDANGSSPAIRDDGSIIVGGTSHVTCLTSAGSLDWQFPVTNAVNSAVTIGPQGNIYFVAGRFLHRPCRLAAPSSQRLANLQEGLRSHRPLYSAVGRAPWCSASNRLAKQPYSILVCTSGCLPVAHHLSIFKWYKDTLPISGATNSILGIGSVQLGDAGALYSHRHQRIRQHNQRPSHLDGDAGPRIRSVPGDNHSGAGRSVVPNPSTPTTSATRTTGHCSRTSHCRRQHTFG